MACHCFIGLVFMLVPGASTRSSASVPCPDRQGPIHLQEPLDEVGSLEVRGLINLNFEAGAERGLEVTVDAALKGYLIVESSVTLLSVRVNDSFDDLINSCGRRILERARPSVTLKYPNALSPVMAFDGAHISFVGPLNSGSSFDATANGATIEMNDVQAPSITLAAVSQGQLSLQSASSSVSVELSADFGSELSMQGNVSAGRLASAMVSVGGKMELQRVVAPRMLVTASDGSTKVTLHGYFGPSLSVKATDTCQIDLGESVVDVMDIFAGQHADVRGGSCGELVVDLAVSASVDTAVTGVTTGIVTGRAALVVRGSEPIDVVTDSGGTVTRIGSTTATTTTFTFR